MKLKLQSVLEGSLAISSHHYMLLENSHTKKNFPPKLYVSGPTKCESILDTQMKLSIKGKMK